MQIHNIKVDYVSRLETNAYCYCTGIRQNNISSYTVNEYVCMYVVDICMKVIQDIKSTDSFNR
jgi:hypothetical protein